MAHPVKKVYKQGTPGDARLEAGVSLRLIKDQIKSKLVFRCELRRLGLIA